MQQANPIYGILQEVSNVLDVSVLSRISMIGYAPAEANLYGVAQSMFQDMNQPLNSKCSVSLTVNGVQEITNAASVSLVGAETYELQPADEVLSALKDILFYVERSHDSIAIIKKQVIETLSPPSDVQARVNAIKFEMSPLSKQLIATVIRLYVARLNAEYLETFGSGKHLKVEVKYTIPKDLESPEFLGFEFLKDMTLNYEIL